MKNIIGILFKRPHRRDLPLQEIFNLAIEKGGYDPFMGDMPSNRRFMCSVLFDMYYQQFIISKSEYEKARSAIYDYIGGRDPLAIHLIHLGIPLEQAWSTCFEIYKDWDNRPYLNQKGVSDVQ